MSRKYTEVFKQEAVALALSSDKTNAQIARDLGINCKTFSNWIVATMKPSNRVNQPIKADYQELERQNKALKKELELRQKEVEVLKDAAAYFAQNQQ